MSENHISKKLSPEEIFHLGNGIDEVLEGKEVIDALIMHNREGIIISNFLKSIAKARGVKVFFLEPIYRNKIKELMNSDTLLLAGLNDNQLNSILDSISDNIEVINIGLQNKKASKQKKNITIYRTHDANTRSAKKGITKDEIEQVTLNHIKDVQSVGNWLIKRFKSQLAIHDHTKIDHLDEFYADFIRNQLDDSVDFKELNWYKNIHMRERHHLNTSVPLDVNLFDVLEMIIDCTCAGLARSEEVYPIRISHEILDRAIDNTIELIKKNTIVVKDNQDNIDDNIGIHKNNL